MPIASFTLKRILTLILTAGAVLLAGCSAASSTDRNPANKLYRCDRNGTQEERQAC